MERLDKVLSNLGYGTRKEIKQVVKKGFVTVNDEKVKDSGLQIDPEKDTIVINGEKVEYKKLKAEVDKIDTTSEINKWIDKNVKNLDDDELERLKDTVDQDY